MHEFLRTGEFGCIKLGDSPDKLKSSFGAPPQVGGKTRHRIPGIWKYGDVEFHLSEDRQHVWLIFCDTFDALNMGASVSFDRWFFEGHPSCEIIERELSSAGISYARRDIPQEPTGYLLNLNSGVELLFSTGADPVMHPGKPGLFGFQYSDYRFD